MQIKKNRLFLIIILLLFSSLFILRIGANEYNQPNVPIPSGEIRPSADDEGYYEAQFRLEQATTRFYITTMDPGDVWYINLTAVYRGVFYIYMFDSRPRDNYLTDSEDLINPKIREDSIAYNETPIDIFSTELNMTLKNIQLNYTATHEKLYYIEIILVENGPDTYELMSSQEIEPYFIPFISGYPYYIIGMISICSVFLILNRIKKRSK